MVKVTITDGLSSIELKWDHTADIQELSHYVEEACLRAQQGTQSDGYHAPENVGDK